jgi:hypothetical protein
MVKQRFALPQILLVDCSLRFEQSRKKILYSQEMKLKGTVSQDGVVF